MFNDVDDTLRDLLIADVPIKKSEVTIAFDRPTREWSSQLAKPTLNLFLYDIREREELKDDLPIITRDENGRAVKTKPPRRIDLAYMITAWTKEPKDEHRILAGVLASMYRNGEIAAQQLQGDLKLASYPIQARVSAPDELTKPVDLWGVLDNEMRASLSWVLTAPMDVFKPITGPLVRTKDLRFGDLDQAWQETSVQIAGLAHLSGDPLAGVAGVKVSVVGTAFEALSDDQGKFSFTNLPPGEYTWRMETPDGETKEQKVIVPSENYDVEL